MRHLWLLVMTSLLTILIWVVADYSLSDTATLKVYLNPVPSGSADMLVTALRASEEPYEIQVSGKQTIISRLKSRDSLALNIPVSPRESGVYKLTLMEELRSNQNELSEVIVQNVNPPTMTIQVDHNIEVTMPILVQPGSLNYEGPIMIEPTEVLVTISELAYESLPPNERKVLLYPDEYLRTAPRGKHITDSVPLTKMVGDVGVQLDPDSVTLRFKLAEELREETLKSIPIKIEASLDLFNGYNVEVKGLSKGAPFTQPITIEGPSHIVGQLLAERTKIWGVITLSAEDKANPGQYRYLKPRFNLPEGVKLVGDTKPVEIRLVKKDNA